MPIWNSGVEISFTVHVVMDILLGVSTVHIVIEIKSVIKVGSLN